MERLEAKLMALIEAHGKLEARARAANLTAGLAPAQHNSTLAGAEANAAPYSRMLMVGVLIVVESLLGVLGALRTQKHRDRRRGVLLFYHAVLLATASSCIWLAAMCLFFRLASVPLMDQRSLARRPDYARATRGLPALVPSLRRRAHRD